MMTLASVLLIIGIILWGVLDYLNTSSKEGIGVLLVVLILIVFGAKLIKNKYESIKRGEPFKDERSRKIETKAAAYAFYIGIYWLLALSIMIDTFKLEIPASSVPSVGLVGMTVIFGLSYLYLNKKGE